MKTKHRKIASAQLRAIVKKEGPILCCPERFPVDTYTGPVYFSHNFYEIFPIRHLIIEIFTFRNKGVAYVLKPEYLEYEKDKQQLKEALEKKAQKDKARLEKFSNGDREFYEPKFRKYYTHEGDCDLMEDGPDYNKPREARTYDRIRYHCAVQRNPKNRHQRIFY